MRNELPSSSGKNFADRVRESIQTYLGKQGDKLDRGVTVRDLVDSGIVELPRFWQGGSGSVPFAPGAAIPSDPQADLTPPPAPTGFMLASGITNVFVEHSKPMYGNHDKTILYGVIVAAGAALPTFDKAVELASFTGTVFAYATNPSTTYRMWIKWRSTAGILSAAPAGGINGLEVRTGEDVALLLEALTGEITESQLYTDLGARIDLIDGSALLENSVNARVASEALARANADIAERDDRVAAITVESIARANEVQQAAYAALEATLAANQIQIDVAGDIALARTELTQDIVDGISAEAAQRLVLAAKLDTDIGTTLAAVTDEATARATADAAEATQRTTLAAQILGADGTGLNSGLIYNERSTRVTEDLALSQQITLLSAGAGEQFDWSEIWYFDDDSEGWTGNGTPVQADGWLRPANATTPSIISPTVAVDGAKYSQLRFRIRKYGSPVWAGNISWSGGSTTAAEPTYDANGIGLVTINQAWSGTVTSLTLALYAAQTATDYHTFDWVAVGRPSPGASSAQLLEEQTVRASADSALTTSLTTLSTQVNNATTGLPAAHAAIVSEASTRASADTAEAAARTLLAVRVTNAEGDITTNASDILTEATVRADGDSTNATAISSLSSQVNDPATGLPQTRADLITTQTTLATETAASAREIKSLRVQSQQMDETLLRDVLTTEQTRTTLLGTLALAQQELNTSIVDGLSAEATARLALEAVVATNESVGAAALTTEQTARATADTALVESVTALNATVISNDTTVRGYITDEQVARSTGDSALASELGTISASITTVDTNVRALITTEQTARVDADAAEATARLALQSTVDGDRANVTNNYYTKVSTDGIVASTVTSLQAYADNSAATALDASGALITTLESTKIGYCTIGAYASDHTNKTTCEAAGGTWHVGLPLATSVKQVSISDGATTAALEQRFTAQKTINDDLSLSYTVKLDAGGKVAGFGLYNATGTPSVFAIRADRFYVAPPETGGGTATEIIPFTVQATATTIGGQAVPAGVYINDAYIKNGTITNAKIAFAAVDDASIANLDAVKITSGFLNADRIEAESITAGKIDARGLSIKDAAGNVILSAGSSIQNQIAPYESGATVGATTTQVNAIVTAGNTADRAETEAYNANQAATAAQTSANNAQTTADAKLAKSGADIMTGPISLNAATAILVGTTTNGLYLGNTGIVGRKSGSTTFSVDASGNAIFKGDLTGASGTFSGTLRAGSSPAVSGTSMTGSGGVIQSDGTFALGNSTTNISFTNGGSMYLNGSVVATGNIKLNAVTAPSYTQSASASLVPGNGAWSTRVKKWVPLINGSFVFAIATASQSFLSSAPYHYHLHLIDGNIADEYGHIAGTSTPYNFDDSTAGITCSVDGQLYGDSVSLSGGAIAYGGGAWVFLNWMGETSNVRTGLAGLVVMGAQR